MTSALRGALSFLKRNSSAGLGEPPSHPVPGADADSLGTPDHIPVPLRRAVRRSHATPRQPGGITCLSPGSRQRGSCERREPGAWMPGCLCEAAGASLRPREPRTGPECLLPARGLRSRYSASRPGLPPRRGSRGRSLARVPLPAAPAENAPEFPQSSMFSHPASEQAEIRNEILGLRFR
jgi:hypothetical protein